MLIIICNSKTERETRNKKNIQNIIFGVSLLSTKISNLVPRVSLLPFLGEGERTYPGLVFFLALKGREEDPGNGVVKSVVTNDAKDGHMSMRSVNVRNNKDQRQLPVDSIKTEYVFFFLTL